MVDVLVTGTFNIVHSDHVRLLEFASRYGSVTVGVNADPYLEAKYGDNAVPLVDRVHVLKALRVVSDVVVFPEENPSKLIRRLRPKYFVRGPDYRGVVLPEQAALDEVGARLLIRPGTREYSSTQLLTTKSAFSKLNVLDL